MMLWQSPADTNQPVFCRQPAGSPPPHIYATPLDAIRLEGHRSKGAEALLAGGVPDFKLIVLILNADFARRESSTDRGFYAVGELVAHEALDDGGLAHGGLPEQDELVARLPLPGGEAGHRAAAPETPATRSGPNLRRDS